MTMKKCCRSIFHLKNRLLRDIFAEFIGTFILVTFAIGSGAQYVLSKGSLSSFLTVNFAGGMGLTLGIYFSGGVSGGSLNPAVTLALCLKGAIPWYKWPFYTLAEFAGAFVAAVVQYGIYYDALNHYDGGIRTTTGNSSTAIIFATYPQEFVSTTNAFFDQVFGTFLLIGCILAITDKKNMMPNTGLLPIALGSIVFAIGTSFGFNCGYAINPCRDLAPRAFTALAGWGAEPFSYRDYNWFWVPIVGPMVGSFFAWVVYSLFITNHWPEEEETTSTDDSKDDKDTSYRKFSEVSNDFTVSTIDNFSSSFCGDKLGMKENVKSQNYGDNSYSCTVDNQDIRVNGLDNPAYGSVNNDSTGTITAM